MEVSIAFERLKGAGCISRLRDGDPPSLAAPATACAPNTLTTNFMRWTVDDDSASSPCNNVHFKQVGGKCLLDHLH